LAAGQLVAHRKWIKDLGIIPDDVFAGLDVKAETIRDLRHKSEHVVEYFLGRGHNMESWWHTSDGGSADASATVDDKIGGRLSWNEVAKIADKLLKDMAPYKQTAAV
jgi:hypothetical protein